MNTTNIRWSILCMAFFVSSHSSADELAALRQELNILREAYGQRISELEQKIFQLEEKAADSNLSPLPAAGTVPIRQTGNSFNPAISLVLDGQYAAYQQDPEDWQIPGLPLGGEAGLAEEGMSLGHSELSMSANIDDKFYGKLTVALAEHEGDLEVELEEAFFQTLGLPGGLTFKGGRFFSSVGYLNQQHDHVWDFIDAPLAYAVLFGNKYIDDGVQLSVLLPTDMYLEAGIELLRGSRFPGGGDQQGAGSRVVYLTSGGDLGHSHSWQAGVSYMEQTIRGRTSVGHAHEDPVMEEIPEFKGDTDMFGINMVYKWAPGGYGRDQNLKIQLEYFDRGENGLVTMLDSDPLELSSLRSDVSGYYAQAVHRFNRNWRWGLRYDRLNPKSRGDDFEVLEEAGLLATGFDPKRYSAMVEWVPSEFSRVRLQYNQDKTLEHGNKQILLQYTFSLGDHQAHTF